MNIKHAAFIGSFTKISQCPKDPLPEYAFIGRSNVGKSSLINMLTGRKALAKVSHTPGKTKLLNYFKIDDAWYLVDLPGYGYAKVSKSERQSWDKMIRAYLANRSTLSCVFVLIDSRIPPQKIDLEFIHWLGSMQVPFVITFTKIDKIKKNAIQKQVNSFYAELKKMWEDLPECFVTSSVTNAGYEEIHGFIESINKDLPSPE
ncbi:MAG: YihA family ribosome biogenesis GTP-binding protein [Bacteroidetes bacterium]|nr:YihA family ribosome biogenesis GTP-binding protein [Bacteroidota bacterium]